MNIFRSRSATAGGGTKTTTHFPFFGFSSRASSISTNTQNDILQDECNQTMVFSNIYPSTATATPALNNDDTMSTASTCSTETSATISISKHDKDDEFFMSETDYNLLRHVITQVGTFNPLPSLTNLNTASDHNNHDKMLKMKKPKQMIVVLEARGELEKDKDTNGHRRDTMPIANAVDQFIEYNGQKQNVNTAVLQFIEEVITDNQEEAVRSNYALGEYLKNMAHGIIVRVNPGTLSPISQKNCDNMLRELADAGVKIMTHPDVASTLGAKDSLVKIKHLKLGMEDTEVYYTPEALREGLLKSIAFQPRVIKQNRGSQGEGVWIVKLKDESAYCSRYGECKASLDTEIVLMEAYDNHIEYHTIGEFIEFCINGRTTQSGTWSTQSNGQYFEGGLAAGAMVVDQRFLPRIVEGEVRCLMVGSQLVEIVHKKPKEGGLSATLQSGAVYTKYTPDDPKFSALVDNFKHDIPQIMQSFGLSDQPLPLLWTVDYIYGDRDDELYAGEINCSCPGLTQQLDIVSTVARVAFENVFLERR